MRPVSTKHVAGGIRRDPPPRIQETPMTLQRNLLAILIVSALGIGPAMSQDAPPPPPDEQTMDPVAYVPDAVDPDDIVEPAAASQPAVRSEEPTSELQSLIGTSYSIFCLKNTITKHHTSHIRIIQNSAQQHQ